MRKNDNKWDFLILYNGMCQHLEDLRNSVGRYFQGNQFMMLKSCLGKISIQGLHRPLYFNATVYENFIESVSDSISNGKGKGLRYENP